MGAGAALSASPSVISECLSKATTSDIAQAISSLPHEDRERLSNSLRTVSSDPPDVTKEMGTMTLTVDLLSGKSREVFLQHGSDLSTLYQKVAEAFSIPRCEIALSLDDRVLKFGSPLLEQGVVSGVTLACTRMDSTAIAAEIIQDAELAASMLEGYSAPGDLKTFAKPPKPCEVSCLGVLHLTAGWDHNIELDENGRPAKPEWENCRKMMTDPRRHGSQLRKFKDAIDSGMIALENVEEARRIKDDFGGSRALIASTKISLCSGQGHAYASWLVAMIRYFDLNSRGLLWLATEDERQRLLY